MCGSVVDFSFFLLHSIVGHNFSGVYEQSSYKWFSVLFKFYLWLENFDSHQLGKSSTFSMARWFVLLSFVLRMCVRFPLALRMARRILGASEKEIRNMRINWSASTEWTLKHVGVYILYTTDYGLRKRIIGLLYFAFNSNSIMRDGMLFLNSIFEYYFASTFWLAVQMQIHPSLMLKTNIPIFHGSWILNWKW